VVSASRSTRLTRSSEGRLITHSRVRMRFVGGLAHLAQAEHAAPAQPPCRRRWRQVRRAVWVQGADECYGCSEVEDSRLDCLVHAQTISNIAHTVLSASCGQTKSRHMGFRANRRQPLDRLISGLPVIPTQSRTPPASSIGRDLQAVSTKSHAAPAASSLLAGVVEVQHTLSTLADAVTTGFGEQCCCAVR
jgi:hypothetical protein